MKCLKPIHLCNGRVVPCGRCAVCRDARCDEWITRFFCESEAFKHGAFFGTLTYNDEALEADDNLQQNLRLKDIQNFFKRVKRALGAYKSWFRYTYCGEYGSQFGRPHYHFIICGASHRKYPGYIERRRIKNIISKCWTDYKQGSFVDISTIKTPQKAIKYMIHYQHKTEGQWCIHDGETKEQFEYRTGRVAPFVHYSSGIGKDYFEKNKDRIFELGYLEFEGHKCAVPRYFRKKMQCCGSYEQQKKYFEQIKAHIDCEADEFYKKKHRPLEYRTARESLDRVDTNMLAKYMSAWYRCKNRITAIRNRFNLEIRGIYDELKFIEQHADVFYNFCDCKLYFFVKKFKSYREFRKHFEKFRIFDADNESIDADICRRIFDIKHECVLAIVEEEESFRREIQRDIHFREFEEILNQWNELLSCIYLKFEPLYIQRAKNCQARIKRNMEARYANKNKEHD